MERMINKFVFWLSVAALLSACGNDDSHKGEGSALPSQAVETAFWTRYPTASSVEWERAGIFQKAEFVLNSTDYETWYTSSGTWLQTEYSSAFTNLPSVVKDFLANSINYPPTIWIPQQTIEIEERRNYPVWYGVELEKANEEITVWTDAEAFDHYDVIEDLDEGDIPQVISRFLAVNYKYGWLTEAVKLPNGSIKMNLLDGDKVKQVNFSSAMEWMYTEWPVLFEDIPESVKNVLSGEAYKDYSVKRVRFQQLLTEEYYHIILQDFNLPGSPTISVNIDAQGKIV